MKSYVGRSCMPWVVYGNKTEDMQHFHASNSQWAKYSPERIIPYNIQTMVITAFRVPYTYIRMNCNKTAIELFTSPNGRVAVTKLLKIRCQSVNHSDESLKLTRVNLRIRPYTTLTYVAHVYLLQEQSERCLSAAIVDNHWYPAEVPADDDNSVIKSQSSWMWSAPRIIHFQGIVCSDGARHQLRRLNLQNVA